MGGKARNHTVTVLACDKQCEKRAIAILMGVQDVAFTAGSLMEISGLAFAALESFRSIDTPEFWLL
jgi:hypothetical protein